jgi:hypothetical protein
VGLEDEYGLGVAASNTHVISRQNSHDGCVNNDCSVYL